MTNTPQEECRVTVELHTLFHVISVTPIINECVSAMLSTKAKAVIWLLSQSQLVRFSPARQREL